jgi:putative sterol carrier protein
MSMKKYAFPSDEWIKKFMDHLNDSETYEEAAKNWEGDFVYEVIPDGDLKEKVRFYLDFWHGKCREAYMMDISEEKESEFVYSGKYSDWRKLIDGQLDPIRSIFTRKFKLKGNLAKVMRSPRAAVELVKTASSVPTEWPSS